MPLRAQTPPLPPDPPPLTPSPDGCQLDHPYNCAIPLVRGAVAPYSGQLLSTDLALRLGQEADGCEGRLMAAVARAQADAAIDLHKEQAARQADLEAFSAQMQQTQEQLDRAHKLAEAEAPPFFAQPSFVAPVAAVLSAGVVVWALHH